MKPNRAEILNKAQLCVTKLFMLFQFSPTKMLKINKNLPLILYSKIQVQYLNLNSDECCAHGNK